VTVERSPNAFAQFGLQEHPAVMMTEDRAIPLATLAVGIKKAMVGGQGHLDLFRPYTEEFLAEKVNEWTWGERPPW